MRNRQRNKAAIALGSDVSFGALKQIRLVPEHERESDLTLASEIERIGSWCGRFTELHGSV